MIDILAINQKKKINQKWLFDIKKNIFLIVAYLVYYGDLAKIEIFPMLHPATRL